MGPTLTLSIAPGGGRLRFTAQEALAAVYWPTLRGPERHCGFAAALRTNRGGFRLAGTQRPRLPLALAGLAALGLVLEVFVVEEVLFSRCKDKFGSALRAL
jgi:hypothetical protein